MYHLVTKAIYTPLFIAPLMWAGLRAYGKSLLQSPDATISVTPPGRNIRFYKLKAHSSVIGSGLVSL
ncbi:hypothetical protein XENTR_v10013150 [Xenopus tropicalis]|nr:hypothetical protein XENTR_v10013150 [Xenopus tropicalis]